MKKSQKPLIRFGASSFSSTDWVGPFYPEGTQPAEFLKYYSQKFNTVEIDSSYYATPSARTVDGWVEKTPEDFVIAAKFPRAIVHGGESATPNGETLLTPKATYGERDRFLKVISRLGERLGPLVLQFPYFSKKVFASKSGFLERLDQFMTDLPTEYRYGIEIRNRNWLTSEFVDLCRRHNAALVLVDQAWMPLPDEIEKEFDPITTDFTYIRLLGDRKEIEAITTTWEKEVVDRGKNLETWANYLVKLTAQNMPTYLFINNHYAGHAPATIRRLQEEYSRLLEMSKDE